MKREINNGKSDEFVEKVVKQVQDEMEENFNIAFTQMNILEKELADTLTEEQKELYQNFLRARENFYKKAKTIYKKRF